MKIPSWSIPVVVLACIAITGVSLWARSVGRGEVQAAKDSLVVLGTTLAVAVARESDKDAELIAAQDSLKSAKVVATAEIKDAQEQIDSAVVRTATLSDSLRMHLDSVAEVIYDSIVVERAIEIAGFKRQRAADQIIIQTQAFTILRYESRDSTRLEVNAQLRAVIVQKNAQISGLERQLAPSFVVNLIGDIKPFAIGLGAGAAAWDFFKR